MACHFLALLGAHHILHVSRMRVNIEVKDFLTLEDGTDGLSGNVGKVLPLYAM
jgi:hypothetical protein